MPLTREKQKQKENRIRRDRSNWNKGVWKHATQNANDSKLMTHEARVSWFKSRH